MEKIDTSKPVYIYDDNGNCSLLLVLYENYYEDNFVCLCSVIDTDTSNFLCTKEDEINICNYDIILFDKFTGEILTKNYQYWKAKN